MAAHRDAAGATALRRGYLTYWVTRDSVGGVALDKVRVWIREPRRAQFKPWPERALAGSVRWYASLEDVGDGSPIGSRSALYAEWSLDECRLNTGTIPDDDRQCLRKEGVSGVGNPLKPGASS